MKRYGKWIAGIALSTLCLTAKTANAAILYNSWNYAIDSLDDGSGGTSYEINGLAYKRTGNTLIFALSSGMPLTGNANSGAGNGSIGYGDLMINFSGNNLTTSAAFQNSLVFGVRFSSTNDSGVATTGVYNNITVKGVASSNLGYGTLQDYLNAGFGRTHNAMGDLDSSETDVKNYLGNGVMYNEINSGTKIGDITSLTRTDLNGLGLDFSHFAGADPGGSNVFGFSFDASLLPASSFKAHVFEECINDGVAVFGTNVPEPGTYAMLGSGVLSLGVFALRRRKR